jgi:hypothetical protein
LRLDALRTKLKVDWEFFLAQQSAGRMATVWRAMSEFSGLPNKVPSRQVYGLRLACGHCIPIHFIEAGTVKETCSP